MTPDTPSDPPLRQVQLRQGPLSYTEEGAGPTLVAIHGLPGSARDFRWLGAALEGGVRLVRLELPGFGQTPLATGPGATQEARADVVIEAASALGLRRYVVLGHSMGGAVAAAVAARDPERVAGLALLASVGVEPHAALRAFPLPGLVSGALRVWPVRRALAPGLRRHLEGAGFKGHSDEALAHCVHCVAGTSLDRHAAHLRSMRAPTLVAWTQDDPMVEDAIGERLYWACTTGPRLRFPSGGHNLQKTRAVEIAAALRAWTGQLGVE